VTAKLPGWRPLLALATLAGCATHPVAPRDPAAPISTSSVPYHVAVLDTVTVKYSNGRKEVLTVEQDGSIATPDGSLALEGAPVEDARSKVRRAFPGATAVEVEEFRPNRVTVLGEVFHQIHTDLGDGPMRVMDAIAAANGFTPLANKRRVRLVRENAGRVEVYELDLREMMRGTDLAQNFLLQPGDVITVPRNFL
jgi:polysaccharide export outer membrane protein